ncbi:MAG TPA: ATP-binding protein, partial [Oscillospiraceae bacterium]|nr:ATP-binding protein [Oscillospiraceae bacterium]
LDVLDEKSKRLKNLIEDLTEASKASTGNIKINREPINLSELAIQVLGEHSDAFESTGLNIVYDAPENEPIVFADSQYTWRIIENLISNVKKYAQPNTRVYMEVYTDFDYGVFSLKNISKNALNIPVSELTERFVRGDSSRTGEGSGLGLSIAESLCQLQKGKFALEIDGDLFKAKVKLPLYDGVFS